MSNEIAVDPQNVIGAYQQELTQANHSRLVAQAAVNQLSSELSTVQDQLAQREAEIVRLTAVPDSAEQIAPSYPELGQSEPAQWGNMESTTQQ